MTDDALNQTTQTTQQTPPDGQDGDGQEARMAQIEQTAKGMGFRNPALAARYASFESDPEGALKALSTAEPHLLAPKVGATNPPVVRQPATTAQRIRSAIAGRRSKSAGR